MCNVSTNILFLTEQLFVSGNFQQPDFYLIFLQNYLSNHEFSSFRQPDYLILSDINQVIRLGVVCIFTCYLGCFVVYQVKIRLLFYV